MTRYELGQIRAFVTVYETRSATAAADALDISQPSISYALARLRGVCGDPLFVRSGQQLAPTALAQTLYPELRRALNLMDDALGGTTDFDPRTADNAFRIMMTDIGIAGLLPPLARAIADAAPHATLDVQPFDPASVTEALRTGRISACVCVPQLHGPNLRRRTIFENRYTGICAPSHPRIGSRPTLEEYAKETHVSMTPQAGYDGVDRFLLEQEIDRHIAVTLPTFNGVAAVIASTEYLGFAPTLAAQRLSRYGLVRTFELPFETPASTVNLYTLDQKELSPANQWFADLIYATLAAIGN